MTVLRTSDDDSSRSADDVAGEILKAVFAGPLSTSDVVDVPEPVVDGAMLVVDPWHWLTEDGHFLVDNPRLYRRMLRIARFIEYGGELQKSETRETLVECKRRPKGKACPGLMWVVKTNDDGILAYCILCKTDEALIHNWQATEWAGGMMGPVSVDLGGPAVD